MHRWEGHQQQWEAQCWLSCVEHGWVGRCLYRPGFLDISGGQQDPEIIKTTWWCLVTRSESWAAMSEWQPRGANLQRTMKKVNRTLYSQGQEWWTANKGVDPYIQWEETKDGTIRRLRAAVPIKWHNPLDSFQIQNSRTEKRLGSQEEDPYIIVARVHSSPPSKWPMAIYLDKCTLQGCVGNDTWMFLDYYELTFTPGNLALGELTCHCSLPGRVREYKGRVINGPRLAQVRFIDSPSDL